MQQFRVGVRDGPQQPAARIELLAGQFISVQPQFGELAAGVEGALGAHAVAVGRSDVEVARRPQPVIAGSAGAARIADGLCDQPLPSALTATSTLCIVALPAQVTLVSVEGTPDAVLVSVKPVQVTVTRACWLRAGSCW